MFKVTTAEVKNLFATDAQGPYVTFLFNTHVAHQDTEKDILTFKNLVKAAKKRFEHKYEATAWRVFQEKIDALLAEPAFWRETTKSVSIIFSPQQAWVERLQVAVDDQYYVGEHPYILGLIKNAQFNYHYFLLALNRDSMALYEVNNQQLTKLDLPADAPIDVPTALGDELTGGSLNYTTQAGTGNSGSKEGMAYYGVNTKDEEVRIDWVNYYQAIDTYLKDNFPNPEQLPIRLYALPENQTLFNKIAKTSSVDFSANAPFSPAQATAEELNQAVMEIRTQLQKQELADYHALTNQKFIDQLVDLAPAAQEGRLSHYFISTENFATATNEMSNEAFDHRNSLNQTALAVIKNGGLVFVLDPEYMPENKALIGILRY